MAKAKFKVVYNGPLNVWLDKFISEALNARGCSWTGTGMNMQTGERDISFEVEDQNRDNQICRPWKGCYCPLPRSKQG